MEWEWKNNGLGPACPKFAYALGFDSALDQHSNLAKVSANQQRIQMMSHHIIWFIWANPVKAFHDPKIFMTQSSLPLLFILILLPIVSEVHPERWFTFIALPITFVWAGGTANREAATPQKVKFLPFTIGCVSRPQEYYWTSQKSESWTCFIQNDAIWKLLSRSGRNG